MNERLHVTEDAIVGIEWRESIYKYKLLGGKGGIYIGNVNEFISVICNGIYGVNDGIAIRFRMRGTLNRYSNPDTTQTGIISVYRTSYRLEDLREGLRLTADEIKRVNNAIDREIDRLEINFIAVK